MGKMLTLDFVPHERRIMRCAVARATIPGFEGDFTVGPGHAPFLTTLRPGLVVVDTGESMMRYVVTGGYAEISGENVSILAERAWLLEAFDADAYALALAELRSAESRAEAMTRADAARCVSALEALGKHLGIV